MHAIKRPNAVVLLFSICAWGCGDTKPPTREPTHGGASIPSLCGREPVTTSLGWDEQTALDITPSAAFGAVAGSCDAALSWDASPADSLVVVPRAGESQMSVSVRVDESSARLIEATSTQSSFPCPAYLEADADVGVASADGTFAEQGRVTLRYYSGRGVEAIRFEREQDELGGGLRIDGPPSQQVSLAFHLSGAGAACAGEIWVMTSQLTAGGASGGGGRIGSWSNTGCPLATEPLALDGSSAPGAAFLRGVEQAWGDTSFAGVWDDGSKTSLILTVQPDAELACVQSGVSMATMPVRVTYSTEDGRLASHEAAAYVNGFKQSDVGFGQLQLWLSERSECGGPEDVLPYGDCRALTAVEVQLSLNEDGDPAGGELSIYEYTSTPAIGAAARVSTLTLTSRN